MDSFESRMNPRFLAESEKGMLWEPRVIESGRGPVEGFKEDEKGKRRASVLSSFSLSWFSVIHVFMLSVYALSSLVRLVTSLRGADFWSCVSSAKSWWFTEWLAMISERGVVYRTKRMGPSMEPRVVLFMLLIVFARVVLYMLFVFCFLFFAFIIINLSHVSPEGFGVVRKAIFYSVFYTCTKLQGIFNPIRLLYSIWTPLISFSFIRFSQISERAITTTNQWLWYNSI